MTYLTAFLTSIALFSGVYAQGESGDRHRGGARKGAPRPEEFLKAFDRNHDKKVSQEEFGTGERAARLSPEIREKIFGRLDKDGDGFITIKEFQAMAPKKGGNQLVKADLDKDGRISREEFVGYEAFAKIPEERLEKMFIRLDRNSDGFLDPKDGRLGGRKGRRGVKHLPRLKMKGLDFDRNGSLSWEEFKKAPAVLIFSKEEKRGFFEKLDADKNGEVTPKELRSNSDHSDGKPRSKK